MFTPTLGGATDWIVLAAVQGYKTPANASAVDGVVYYYRAESADKSEWEEGSGAYTALTTTLARTTITTSSNGNAKVTFSAAPTVFIVASVAALRNAAALFNTGVLPIARVASGTPDGTKFVRDDSSLQSVVVPLAASQSDQESASSTSVFVSPGRQQYHPSAAKVWATWGVTSTILASYGASSITDIGTGNWRVNYSVNFSSANYAPLYVGRSQGSTFVDFSIDWNTAPSASGCTLLCWDSSRSASDPQANYFAAFGDQ
jgi:hypothetical protein